MHLSFDEGVGLANYYSYLDFPVFGDALDLKVNLGSGNLYFESTLISLASSGVDPSTSLVWNSNSPRQGPGFTTIGAIDYAKTGLTFDGDDVIFHDRTGAEYRFVADGNNFTAPLGLNATLTFWDNYFYELSFNRTGEALLFNQQGWLWWTGDHTGNGNPTISENLRDGVRAGYQGHNLTSVFSVEPGQRIDYTYSVQNEKPRLTKVADQTGREATFQYSGDELSSYTLPGAGSVSLTYTNVHNLIGSISHGGRTATMTYEQTGWLDLRVTKIVVTSGSQTSTTQFSYGADGVTTVTDARGGQTKYHADEQFRITKTVDQLGREREQSWTANSDIATTTNGFAAGGSGPVTETEYDGLNNPTSVTLPTGAATQALYAQGPNCPSAQTSNPYRAKCTIDADGSSASMTYDEYGNLLTRTDTTPNGTQQSISYTRENVQGTVCGAIRTQICKAVDGNGKTTSYEYDAVGNVTKVIPPAPALPTIYGYDGLNRVTSVTNGAGHETQYAYDARDRIVQVIYDNGSTLTTEYNLDGTVKKETDSATGTAIAYTYNVLGFQTKQTTTSTTAGLNQVATMTYDAVGNLTRLYDSVGAAETAYTYDAANQLTRAQLQGGNCTAANSPGCIRYEYDDNALEKARIFPFGARQDTVRDNSGRPTRITTKDKNGAVQNDIAYSYALNGADSGSVRTRTSHKEQGITAGAVTTYGYDSRSRLTSAVEKTGTTTSASWTYQYDKADNRTRQVRAGSTGATAGTINYTYDAANRLTGATGSSGAWTYDGAGNQTRNALTGVSSTYGDRLQATANGSTTYSTFGQGNDLQLKVGNNVQKYTTLGAYSTASDRTISRDSDGTALATRVGTTWAYLTTDHLGSTTGLIGADGLYLGGYSYSPYGETRSASTNATVAGNTIRYIGQHLEPTTGLYKLGARFYDASLGRFTQMDPSGQETHPYAYAGCNPVNSLDPSGLAAVGSCAWLDGLAHTLDGVAIGFGTVAGFAFASGIGTPVGGIAAFGGGASAFGAWVYRTPCAGT